MVLQRDLEVFGPRKLMVLFKNVFNTAKPKNQFYVYCAECKSIAEGKIIVQCSECQQQSFVVRKGPRSWDEVLVKETPIQGTCLSEPCKGKDYKGKYSFHCCAHRGADKPPEALPLPLLRVNTIQVKCMKCAEIQEPVLVFPCEYHHVMCIPCFQIYVELALNSRLFILDPRTEMYTLGCPAGCPDSSIPDPHYFKAASTHLYERYKDFAVEDMVLNSGGVVCGCGQKIMCEQFEESDSDDEPKAQAVSPGKQPRRLSLKCEPCGKTYCTRCKQVWHNAQCIAPAPAQRPKDEMRIEKERAALAHWKEGLPDPCIEAFQKDLQEAKEKWQQDHKKKKRWWLF
jgi:parkin